MGYDLAGQVLEFCSCKAICPCWAGEDPPRGVCDAALAWHFERGKVNDVDVSGLTIAVLVHIPANILKGNWRLAVFVDDKATPEQQEALVNVWTGKLGGPVAQLVPLIGEVAGLERAPITFELNGAKGTLRIGDVAAGQQVLAQNANGAPVTLHDTVFSVSAGAPVAVGRAESFRMSAPNLGFQIDLKDYSTTRASFHFES